MNGVADVNSTKYKNEMGCELFINIYIYIYNNQLTQATGFIVNGTGCGERRRFQVSSINTGCEIGKRSRGYRDKARIYHAIYSENCLPAGRSFLVIAETDMHEARTNGKVTVDGEPREQARVQRSRRNIRRNRFEVLQ